MNPEKYLTIRQFQNPEVVILSTSKGFPFWTTKGDTMSLFLDYIENCYFDEQYHDIRRAMKDFEKGWKSFPDCLYRELDFAIKGSFREIRDVKLFPIRFMLMFGFYEERMFAMPIMGRCYYHPEELWKLWNECFQDGADRQEAVEAGILFDIQHGAIALPSGWIWMGNTFVQDFFELERFLKKPIKFPDKNGKMKPIFQQYRMGGKKWIKEKRKK